jgi:hypothetical protein
VGGIVGLAAGILVLLLGQSRIALAMGRDRFIPAWVAKLNWRRTPTRALWCAGAVCAAVAGLVPGRYLQPVINQGTLLLFVVVCVAAWVLLDEVHPRPSRSFRAPGPRIVATLGLATCAFLMVALMSTLTLALIGYIVVSIGVYALVRPRLAAERDESSRNSRRFRDLFRWPGDDFVPTEDLLRPAPPIDALADLIPPARSGPSDGTPTEALLSEQRTPRVRRLSDLIVDEVPDMRRDRTGG